MLQKTDIQSIDIFIELYIDIIQVIHTTSLQSNARATEYMWAIRIVC